MSQMSFRRFARIVRRVMESLPEEFKPHLDNLVVDIEEEADEDETDDGVSPLGMYVMMDPPSLAFNDWTHHHDWPRRIRIFKRPLEEEFPDPKQLEIEIRKTVIHELAHHFGFNERDLEKWDANPNPFGDEEQEEGD